jgi:hypothetical protein
MNTFEAGKSDATRSIGDHETRVRVRVARRTSRALVDDKGKRFRISEEDGVEPILPWGRHSMCPILRAADVEAGPAGPGAEA